MPSNEERKFRQVINYIEDQVGADINRDLLEIAIGAQDVAPLDVETAIKQALESVNNDELRTRLLGENESGNLVEVDAQDLNTGVSATSVAQVTYLARALNSQDLDEFITRVTDSTGSQIDPLNQDALESVATDHLRTSLYADDPGGALTRVNVNSSGELLTDATLDAESVYLDGDDDDGSTLNPNAETLSEAITDPDGLVTYLARSLNSQAFDELRSRIHQSDGTQIDPATQALENALKANDSDELISRITDSDGNEVDPATQALEAALKSNDTDEFVSRLVGTDGNEIQEVALDTAATATDVALVTYLARALESQLEDAIRTRQTSESESRFKHDDATVQSGDDWYIPSAEVWRAGDILNEGVINVEGQIITTGSISGSGTITGGGTVTLESYT